MRDLGLSWQQAVLVVMSTAAIYVTFVVLIRLIGQRALSSRSSFDFAAVIALGAVAGRVILGYTPTLLAGVIGLTSLFALQAGLGILRRFAWVDNAMSNRPLLLMADGRLLPENLRKAHLIEDELRAQLRQAGIRRYSDVACVILERTGAISVLAAGTAIGPELLADVRGVEALTPGIGLLP